MDAGEIDFAKGIEQRFKRHKANLRWRPTKMVQTVAILRRFHDDHPQAPGIVPSAEAAGQKLREKVPNGPGRVESGASVKRLALHCQQR